MTSLRVGLPRCTHCPIYCNLDCDGKSGRLQIEAWLNAGSLMNLDSHIILHPWHHSLSQSPLEVPLTLTYLYERACSQKIIYCRLPSSRVNPECNWRVSTNRLSSFSPSLFFGGINRVNTGEYQRWRVDSFNACGRSSVVLDGMSGSG